MTDSSFPCLCGHPLSEHATEEKFIKLCSKCMMLVYKGQKVIRPFFHAFKPDNLRYLENHDTTR